MRGDDRLPHLAEHETTDPSLRVRRQRNLWLLHRKNDRLLLLQFSDHRQQSEHQQVDRAGPEPRERHAVAYRFGGDKQPHDLSQILPREI